MGEAYACIEQFDQGIVNIMESDLMATISFVLQYRSWNFASTDHILANNLRQLVSDIVLHLEDFSTWDANRKGINYLLSWHLCESLLLIVLGTRWCGISLAARKCSFILWLAIQSRLLTKDNSLCGVKTESHSYLFHDCSYKRLVFRQCPMQYPLDWSNIYIASGIKDRVLYIFLSTVVHNLWLKRNARIHTSKSTAGSLNDNEDENNC